MLDGVKVNLAGHELIIPPLNMAGHKKAEPLIHSLSDSSISSHTRVQNMLEIIRLSVRRNYAPEVLSDETLDDIIDLGNINVAFDAVMGVSGMVKTSGEPLEQEGL